VVKIRLFGQFLLAPFQIPAVGADVLAQRLSVFRNLDHCIIESETAYTNYSICTVFLSCIFKRIVRVSADMSATIVFRRRIGLDPHANEAHCVACNNCPDIWELESGDFAIIGVDITANAKGILPASAGCGPEERVILLPRKLLINAKHDIPDRV
jgi:hypothetical protein